MGPSGAFVETIEKAGFLVMSLMGLRELFAESQKQKTWPFR